MVAGKVARMALACNGICEMARRRHGTRAAARGAMRGSRCPRRLLETGVNMAEGEMLLGAG
jgi:hypothetical protein